MENEKNKAVSDQGIRLAPWDEGGDAIDRLGKCVCMLTEWQILGDGRINSRNAGELLSVLEDVRAKLLLNQCWDSAARLTKNEVNESSDDPITESEYDEAISEILSSFHEPWMDEKDKSDFNTMFLAEIGGRYRIMNDLAQGVKNGHDLSTQVSVVADVIKQNKDSRKT